MGPSCDVHPDDVRVPSKFNASDEGSKVFDSSSIKGLMDALATFGSKDAGSRTSQD